YAQGSSREHAAIAPRYLGQMFVVAKSYARIGWQNLINFGIFPFHFDKPEDYERIAQGDIVKLENLEQRIRQDSAVYLINETKKEEYMLGHNLSPRQVDVVLEGGVINYFKMKQGVDA